MLSDGSSVIQSFAVFFCTFIRDDISAGAGEIAFVTGRCEVSSDFYMIAIFLNTDDVFAFTCGILGRIKNHSSFTADRSVGCKRVSDYLIVAVSVVFVLFAKLVGV